MYERLQISCKERDNSFTLPGHEAECAKRLVPNGKRKTFRRIMRYTDDLPSFALRRLPVWLQHPFHLFIDVLGEIVELLCIRERGLTVGKQAELAGIP